MARKKRRKPVPKSPVWRSPNPDDEFAFNLRDRDEEQAFGISERFSRPRKVRRRIRRVRRLKVKGAYSYLRRVKGRKRRVRIHVPAQYRKRISYRIQEIERKPERICADIIIYGHLTAEEARASGFTEFRREVIAEFTITFSPGRDRGEFWQNYFSALRSALQNLGGSDPAYTAKKLGYEVIVTKVYEC